MLLFKKIITSINTNKPAFYCSCKKIVANRPNETEQTDILYKKFTIKNNTLRLKELRINSTDNLITNESVCARALLVYKLGP